MADNKRPSADQTSTGPEKRKKKIIIVKDRPAMKDRPEKDQGKITVDIPAEYKDMTPSELAQYMKEHPEAAESIKKAVADAVVPALETVTQIAQSGEAIQDIVHVVRRVQFDITETVKAMMQTAFRLPEWAEPDAIEKLYAELEELEPFLNAEVKKRPEYENATYIDLFDQLTIKDAFFFVDPEIVKDMTPPEVDPETRKFIDDLLVIRDAARIARDAQNQKKLLPQLKGYGIPKTFYSPNSTFANALRAIDGKGEIIGAGPVDLPVLNIGKPNEITMYVEVGETEQPATLTIEKPYTEYGRAIHDAAVSIYVDRETRGVLPIITAADIYRTMIGKAGAEKVMPQRKAAITKWIEKLGTIPAKLDATDQVKKYKATVNGEPLNNFVVEDTLLHYKKIYVEIGGKKQVGYLLDEPITYTHAKLIGQVVKAPTALLDIKKLDKHGHITTVSLSNSEERISVKMYVLRRIEVMRTDERRAIDARRKEVRKCEADNRKGTPSKPRPLEAHRKQTRVILFDTIFEAAAIDAKNTKTNIKEYVYNMLDFWKASGHITNWKPRKGKGKAVDAVEIVI